MSVKIAQDTTSCDHVRQYNIWHLHSSTPVEELKCFSNVTRYSNKDRVKFHIIPEITLHRLSVVKFEIKISHYF